MIDRRVRLKCAVPRCSNYDQHLMCPPNLMPVEEFEDIVRKYKKALILQIETDYDSSDKSEKRLDGALCEQLESVTDSAEWELRLHELVNLVESYAFKQGFYLAAGLIGGECQLCPECVSPRSGLPCKHPFKSRPSMEAMGVDVVQTCRNAGLKLALSSDEKVRWTGLILLD